MTFYLQHFGLREAPFGSTPTTEFFYGGGRRGEILHTLQYAINAGEGIVMITGEVGSGKTMLLRSLLEKLQQQNTDLVYIPNPSLSGREILYNICEELELRMDENRPDTVRMLQNCLIDRYAKGRRVVALIDEAQAMPDESLEEIRLLSNLETARGKLLQIVLFGQPELEDKLRRHNMRQLRERITLALELKPFGLDDVRDYISTRLNAAGYDGGRLFSAGALKLIAVISQGLSRRINVLADKSMLSAFERQSLSVSYADAKRAVQGARYGKLRFHTEHSRRISRQITAILAFASVGVLALAAYSQWGDKLRGMLERNTPPPQIETPAQPAARATETATAIEIDDTPTTAAEEPPLQLASDTETITDGLLPPLETETATATAEVRESAKRESKPAEESPQVQTENETATTETKTPPPPEVANENASANTNINKNQPQFTLPGDAAGDIVDNPAWQHLPADSFLRARLNATHTLLNSENGRRGYTARLVTVLQEREAFLEKFLRRFASFYPIRNVMIYPAHIGNRDRFVVTYGVYQNREESAIFINNVPADFSGGKPFAQLLTNSARESSAL